MNYSPNGGIVPGAISTALRPNDPNFPADVLQRIFDLVIRGPVVLPPPPDDQRRILAQVCSWWRTVVTSTPYYWSSFELVQLDHVPLPENHLQLAQVLLGRSKDTVPLFIRFRSSEFPSNVTCRMLKFVIRSYAHRLWFLSCVVTKQELRAFFGAVHAVRFPLLQHIDLKVLNEDGHIATRTPVKGSIDLSGFNHRAPSLRHVALRILDGIHIADLRLPWGLLTQIDLGDTPTRANTFMRVMEQSLVLQDGVFCIKFARSYSATFRPITIPHVRRLRLRLIRPGRDTRIFSKLRMPSLQELWLEREEVGQSMRDMTLYETLLAWLNAPLKHITIAEHSFPTTTCFIPRLDSTPGPRLIYQRLDGVFHSAHNLTTLYLYPGVFMPPLILEKVASGDFLPFLEKIAVSSVIGYDIVWMAQERNLVSTRPESGPPSSSGSLLAPMVHPVPLNYLDLSFMGCGLDEGSVQKLDDAVGALLLPCGYLLRYVHIPRREASTSCIRTGE
jgi:hypothetical protein